MRTNCFFSGIQEDVQKMQVFKVHRCGKKSTFRSAGTPTSEDKLQPNSASSYVMIVWNYVFKLKWSKSFCFWLYSFLTYVFLRSCWCQIISTPFWGGSTTSPTGCTWRRRTAPKRHSFWSRTLSVCRRDKQWRAPLCARTGKGVQSHTAPPIEQSCSCRESSAARFDIAAAARPEKCAPWKLVGPSVYWSALILKHHSTGTYTGKLSFYFGGFNNSVWVLFCKHSSGMSFYFESFLFFWCQQVGKILTNFITTNSTP